MARTVLVTGASAGIGAATARRLGDAGFRVWGSSRAEPVAPETHGIRWVRLELQDPTSVRAAVRQVVDAEGGLDALVCNAGSGVFGSVEEVPLEAARDVFDANVFGTLATLQAALPALRKSRGRIAIVGSLAGRAPIPFQGHYSATKAATESLASALANELHAHGVSVSLIEPGDTATAFNDNLDFNLVTDSIYGASLDRCRTVIRESLIAAPPPARVARAIERALCDAKPRFRYSAGKEVPLVAVGRRLLPDRMVLWLLRKYFRV